MKLVLHYFAWVFKQRFTFKSYLWLFVSLFLPSAFATIILSIDEHSRALLFRLLWIEAVIIALAPFLEALCRSVWYGLQLMHYDNIQRYPGYLGKKVYYHERYIAEAMYDNVYDKRERIVASAITDRRGVAWVVLEPGRHHHCFGYMAMYGANYRNERGLSDQGFFTNYGRFIDREVARRLAIYNGQCPNPPHSRELFSEDLWDTPPYLREAAIKAAADLAQDE